MVEVDRRLRNAVEGASVVFVIGTGLSAASTSGAPTATWAGLLKSGLERLAGKIDSSLSTHLAANLSYGFEHNDLTAVLQVADRMREQYALVGEYAFAKWMAEDIGALECTDTALRDAITKLPFPVLTTNYDTLLESDGRGTSTWRSPVELQSVLAGTSKNIGHLHGAWNQPDTVVLSNSDYLAVVESPGAQALQHAASSLKSLVYVGYGAGLSDPNFSRLIDWHRSRFIPSAVTHFRLCRADELKELDAVHANDHIVPIVYGERYEDLPGFIGTLSSDLSSVSLSEAGIARDVVAELQREFSDELKAAAVLGEHRESVSTLGLAEVVRPPVLLPVPHADYVNSHRAENTTERVQRLDPFDDAHSSDVVVLAADESAGLTTAIKWLVLESCTYLGGAAPLYLSFRQVGKGPRPLNRLIEQHARAAGLLPERDSVMPPYGLALDDFSPYVSKISPRAIEDLVASPAIVKVIGCRTGVEDDVVEMLSALGVKAQVRYLGRLTAADVREYARLASPTNHADLARRVLDVLQTDNLPRTPYTVALLISVLLRGGALTANASQTSILDDYVGMLLGRGDPHEDARLGLDQPSREALLAGFAKEFVLKETGGLVESDAVAAFERILERLGWSESPVELLNNLIERKVLGREGAHIVFARSSFLHLFSAKRAIQDAPFRDALLTRPLFFSPILMDYAALNRHDGDLIESLNSLLSRDEWESGRGGIFDELEVRVAAEGEVELQGDPDGYATHTEHVESNALELFDVMDEVDSPPFPLTEQELPAPVRLMRILELVSSALRDSDQIEDNALKQRVLLSALEHWGVLMNTLSGDQDFLDFIHTLVERIEAREGAAGDDHEELVEQYERVLPAAIALGGITHTLASRKLARVLSSAVDSQAEAEEGEGAVELVAATAFLVFTIMEDGWVAELRELLRGHENLWVVRNFLLHHLVAAYINEGISEGDRSELADLCVDIHQSTQGFDSERERKLNRESLIQSLKGSRRRRAAIGDRLGELESLEN